MVNDARMESRPLPPICPCVFEVPVIRRKSAFIAAVSALSLLAGVGPAAAESLASALASAYSSNPEINSARAQTRSDDEGVPIARGGRLPTVSLSDSTTRTTTRTVLSTTTSDTNSLSLTVTQDLFTGFRVTNAIRGAEAGVLASRELLRNTVENVLYDAAQAYMDVLRDTAILDIRHKNVLFLEEQVRAANERFNVGENTRTDVAQARARLATARAAVSLAVANLATSRATYRRIIGHDPNGLADGFPYSRLIPRDLLQAVAIGQNQHPIILAAIHAADAQAFAVKQIEGQLLPSVSVEGSLSHSEDFNSNIDPNSASIVGRVTIPIFPSGSVYPRIRQAKELYGLKKIEIDVARDQVRAAIVSAWAQVEASVGAISAAKEGVDAAEIALSGVQEEQRVRAAHHARRA